MKHLATLALALAALSVTASGASATTVLQVDVPTMTRTAEWVVRARVADVGFTDRRDEGGRIFTDVQLEIREVYKGRDVPARYRLRLIGGRAPDGTAVRVPGMPTFEAGEEVVLFLEPTSLGHVPVGLGQGVWRVHRDTAGRPWVRQATGSVNLVRRAPGGGLSPAPRPRYTPARSLEDLVASIQRARRTR